MTRDLSSIIGLMFFGVLLIGAVGVFYKTSYDQDAVVLAITETVRSTAISNADYSSRVEPGELYVLKDDFEQDFQERIIQNQNANISDDATYEYEYLDHDSGASKAIRVIIRDNDKRYQATYKVDIAD